MNTASLEKRSLRKKIRQQRKSLSRQQQKLANEKLSRNLKKSQILLAHRNIALYLGNEGEICPSNLIAYLLKCRRRVYLPVLHPLSKSNMMFCEVKKSSAFRKNRFGILEPVLGTSKMIPARCLSLVLMPLVAFDLQGNRMGMGGGFYDRTFAYKLHRPQSKPDLVGLAHDFQKVDNLPKERWDVPMKAVATELKLYSFN